jgi:hypothetical protein
MTRSRRLLFIIVEGDNDERFVRAAVIPNIRRKYGEIVIWKSAEEPDANVRKFIDAVVNGMDADYIFLTDLDDKPCVTAAKDYICTRYPEVARDRVAVASLEVEGWYLAGLNRERAEACGLDGSWGSGTTDGITKERFCGLQPARFAAETAFRVEVLKNFSRTTATRRSTSFAHFAKKYL